MFIQVNSLVLVRLVQVNPFMVVMFTWVSLLLLLLPVQVNPLVIVMLVQLNPLVISVCPSKPTCGSNICPSKPFSAINVHERNSAYGHVCSRKPTNGRVGLTGSWFAVHNKVLNFHIWILCYHEPYHDNVKNPRKYQWILYLWNLNHTKFILHEYANDHYLWILSVLINVDFVLIFYIDTLHVFNIEYRVISNLKNLILKFPKNSQNFINLTTVFLFNT